MSRAVWLRNRARSSVASSKSPRVSRATMAELMDTEAGGMETVTGFLNVVRQMEIERRDRHGQTNVRAQINGW